MKKIWFGAFVTVVSVCAMPVHANPICTIYDNYKGGSDYRITTTDADALPGISANEFYRGVVQAANEWNEHGHTKTFRYLGSTTATEWPTWASDCTGMGAACCTYSIVRVEDGVGEGGRGRNTPLCKDAGGVARQFLVVVNAKQNSTTYHPWVIGAVSQSIDLLQTLTHEFGHTSRLHHPGNGDAAIMRPTSLSDAKTRQRNVYEYDTYCQHEVEGTEDLKRELEGHKATYSGGSVGSFSNFTGSEAVRRVSVGMTWHVGHWDFSAAYPVSDDYPIWTRNLGTSFSNDIDSNLELHDIGYVDAVWRDRDVEKQRVFYSHYTDYGSGFDAVHRLRQARSSNEFGSYTYGNVSECTFHFSPFACYGNNTSLITTGNPVAVAWMDGPTGPGDGGVTVMGWTDQTRKDDFADRRVRISFGSTSDWTVAGSSNAGVQSKIGPGIACKPYDDSDPNAYNCILLYVDQDDNTNRLRLKKFRHSPGPFGYSLVIMSGYYTTPLNTSSRVAVWYDDGDYYLAARSDNGGQIGIIYRSPNDGVNWWYLTFYLRAMTGPSAVSFKSGGNNAVVVGME